MTEEQKGAPSGAPEERGESDDAQMKAAPGSKARGATFPLTHNAIEHTEFETAEEFLGAVEPLHLFWQPDPTKWIFRGHGDGEWALQAKAHRTDCDYFGEFGFTPPSYGGVAGLLASHAQAKELLNDFAAALNKAGLAIPTLAPEVRTPGMSIRHGDDGPEPETLPLTALAQHVGLPTALLDWTLHARVAAYFAAADAAAKRREGGSLALWAIRRDFIMAPSATASDMTTLEYTGVDGTLLLFRQVPRAGNPYLHAQAGVFTWLRGQDAHDVALDRYLARATEVHPSIAATQGIAMPIVRRISVPQRCAPKLLRLLSYEGVDGSSTFPGYEGVVKVMRERACWDKEK